MTQYRVRETFFRPDEPVLRVQGALPAALFNGLRLLLRDADERPVFLPLRGLQYQAVIEREETVFVDACGGYGHRDGIGGRLIRVAWRPVPGPRDHLTAPVPCEILHYFDQLGETQRRLVGEMQAALRAVLARRRLLDSPGGAARVLALCRR